MYVRDSSQPKVRVSHETQETWIADRFKGFKGEMKGILREPSFSIISKAYQKGPLHYYLAKSQKPPYNKLTQIRSI